ncbi:MAG TPA: acyl-CoA thioesterase [Anaerolineae bacterium]|nr:acyl-CoA thioesterase [Anaerolineae bacterium]HNT05153.1 acyl-CoA thioesterase [Anaerolineae bacterium]
MSLPPKRICASQTTLSQLMHLADANPLGNIHGGAVMRLVDEVGGICAARHVGRPVVTVAIDSMSFHSPIFVGNLVTVRASLNYVGRTSMEVGVRVEAEDVLTGACTHTNSAYLVYVAKDENGEPVEVPPLLAETPEEERRMAEGKLRQEERVRRRRARESRQQS